MFFNVFQIVCLSVSMTTTMTLLLGWAFGYWYGVLWWNPLAVPDTVFFSGLQNWLWSHSVHVVNVSKKVKHSCLCKLVCVLSGMSNIIVYDVSSLYLLALEAAQTPGISHQLWGWHYCNPRWRHAGTHPLTVCHKRHHVCGCCKADPPCSGTSPRSHRLPVHVMLAQADLDRPTHTDNFYCFSYTSMHLYTWLWRLHKLKLLNRVAELLYHKTTLLRINCNY